MDLDEIRLYIRRSVRRQIRESINRSYDPPSDFSSFLDVVSDALYYSEAPSEMIREIDEYRDAGGVLFESLWSAWENVSSEISNIDHRPERLRAWSTAAETYVYDAILEAAEAYDTDDVSSLANDVVKYIRSKS